MEDVQNHAPAVPLGIDCVGVRGLTLPLLVRDRANGSQHTVAHVDLGVDLPAEFKGTHMSRFVESLETWREEISHAAVHRLLETIRKRLHARRAWVRLRFPYFLRKTAPVSGGMGTVAYQCCLTGELDEKKQTLRMDTEVPVMTVCPCSKAISREGAHSQRALVRMSIRMREFSWLEEFIEIAETAGSSAVYTLLKREDEKFVTEDAFAHPTFVEDVARNTANRLLQHEHVEWFSVEVESMESIHNHNAFARIERTVR